jgi:hypothetical protein
MDRRRRGLPFAPAGKATSMSQIHATHWKDAHLVLLTRIILH